MIISLLEKERKPEPKVKIEVKRNEKTTVVNLSGKNIVDVGSMIVSNESLEELNMTAEEYNLILIRALFG